MNLNFNVRASGRKSKHTCFSKASAKVLLFFDMTKYFSKKMHLKMHFLRNCLIISIYYLGPFLQSRVINGAKMVEQAFLRENAPLYIYIIRNARVRVYKETKRGDFRRNHLLCAGWDSNSHEIWVGIPFFSLTINQLVSNFKYHFTLGRFGQILGHFLSIQKRVQRYKKYLTCANFKA